MAIKKASKKTSKEILAHRRKVRAAAMGKAMRNHIDEVMRNRKVIAVYTPGGKPPFGIAFGKKHASPGAIKTKKSKPKRKASEVKTRKATNTRKPAVKAAGRSKPHSKAHRAAISESMRRYHANKKKRGTAKRKK